MMIRSFLFTLFACVCTYFLSLQNQPFLLKVDLQKILKEKAIVLSKKDFTKDMLDLEILNVQKEVTHLLKEIAKDNNAIILTSPTFGDIKDITEDVLNALEKGDD